MYIKYFTLIYTSNIHIHLCFGPIFYCFYLNYLQVEKRTKKILKSLLFRATLSLNRFILKFRVTGQFLNPEVSYLYSKYLKREETS